MGFAEEALQCPCATRLNLDRHGGQWHYPTEVGCRISLERKAGEIPLDPIMPRNHCRRTSELHIAVRGQQSSTREGRLSLQNKECKCEYENSKPFKHRGFLLLSFFRMFTNDDDRAYRKVPLVHARKEKAS